MSRFSDAWAAVHNIVDSRAPSPETEPSFDHKTWPIVEESARALKLGSACGINGTSIQLGRDGDLWVSLDRRGIIVEIAGQKPRRVEDHPLAEELLALVQQAGQWLAAAVAAAPKDLKVFVSAEKLVVCRLIQKPNRRGNLYPDLVASREKWPEFFALLDTVPAGACVDFQ